MRRGKEQLWNDVTERTSRLPRHTRHVEQVRQRHIKKALSGVEIASIKEGPLYDQVVEMLSLEVECDHHEEQLSLLQKKLSLKKEEFWLIMLEEYGTPQTDRLVLDPANAVVLSNAQAGGTPGRTYDDTLLDYSRAVLLALRKPLTAGHFVHDRDLPLWLQQLAAALVSGDLKPRLRRLLEQCLENPNKARSAMDTALQQEMPGWLVHTLWILGQRQKHQEAKS
jgi:hypothetical protein